MDHKSFNPIMIFVKLLEMPPNPPGEGMSLLILIVTGKLLVDRVASKSHIVLI